MPASPLGTACTECGFRPQAGGLSCGELRDRLLARDFSDPARWQWHRLAVDAYCLQHSPYVASAKSLAAHLCGVLIALERGNDEQLLRQLQRWLSTNPSLHKPELPTARGELTIGSLEDASDPSRYGEAVRSWAASVWAAYAPLHTLAGEWLTQALRHAAPVRK